MTKKEELIQFINDNITTKNELLTYERIVETQGDTVVEVGQKGTRGFTATNEHLINAINNGFNDNLIGNIWNDKITVEILSWKIK